MMCRACITSLGAVCIDIHWHRPAIISSGETNVQEIVWHPWMTSQSVSLIEISFHPHKQHQPGHSHSVLPSFYLPLALPYSTPTQQGLSNPKLQNTHLANSFPPEPCLSKLTTSAFTFNVSGEHLPPQSHGWELKHRHSRCLVCKVAASPMIFRHAGGCPTFSLIPLFTYRARCCSQWPPTWVLWYIANPGHLLKPPPSRLTPQVSAPHYTAHGIMGGPTSFPTSTRTAYPLWWRWHRHLRGWSTTLLATIEAWS